MFNDNLKGEILSTGTLIVRPKAVQRADLRFGQAVISGEVVGTVEASERVELKEGARLFEGHCRMTKVAAETPPARDLSVVHLQR